MHRLMHRLMCWTGEPGATVPDSMRPELKKIQAPRPAPLPVQADDCHRYLLPVEPDGSGIDYEIFVYQPRQDPPPQGFPVIYVLDGNANFMLVAEAVRRLSRRPGATGVPSAVVVGIGYPGTADYNNERRYRDFTRGQAAMDPGADAAKDLGGQGDFIGFLDQVLTPDIATHYPVDPARSLLLGHSLAGYFVLDLLCQRPGLFAASVAISPSIWWGRAAMQQALAASAATPVSAFRLYGCVGEWEQDLAPWLTAIEAPPAYDLRRSQRRMIDNLAETATDIATAFGPDASVKFEVHAGEDHASVLIACLAKALRFTLAV